MIGRARYLPLEMRESLDSVVHCRTIRLGDAPVYDGVQIDRTSVGIHRLQCLHGDVVLF